MRAVCQRVRSARVEIAGETVGRIGRGWAVLLGVGPEDNPDVANKLAEKLAYLRCFEDEAGKMNLSAFDVEADVLVVSQFTLYANTSRGRRPSFVRAALPEEAAPLVRRFAERLRELGFHTETGVFGAEMLVAIENDGPVTIILDSDERRSG